MKNRLLIFIIGISAVTGLLSGCGSDSKPVDVPNPDRVERKPWEQMTKEEKIEFIRKTPMPEEAKQKQIQGIEAGTL